MGLARNRSSAFTLVEVTLALAMMTLLTAGLASALVLATRAMPDSDSALRQQVRTADVLDAMAEELYSAVHVLQKSNHGITFLVPDRNGDNKPEKIIYTWSGTPGDPLTRRSGTALQENVLKNVEALELRYEVLSSIESYRAPMTESAEQLLAVIAPGSAADTTVITPGKFKGQSFATTVPAPAAYFALTRVDLRLRKASQSDGTGLLNVYATNGDWTPQLMGSPLATSKILESSLDSNLAPVRVPISGMLPVPRGQLLGITLTTPDVSGEAMDVGCEGSGVAASVGALLSSTGGNWTAATGKGLHFEAWGKLYTPSATLQTVTRSYLRRAQLSARAGTLNESAVLTAVTFGNEPEELSALWRSDFSVSPLLDQNGDGLADWVVAGGGSLGGVLANGVWTAGSRLNSYPDHAFAEVTTVDVHARATTAGASAIFEISPGWNHSSAGILQAVSRLESNGTQTWEVTRAVSSSTYETVVRVTDLPGGEFIRTRLVIDPTRNTCAASVNGVHRRTFTYATFLRLTQEQYASLYSTGGTAQFDAVSIRVGGTPG